MMLALLALLAPPASDASCTVWLATEETSKFGVHVRAEATVEAPAENVLAALEDFDHYPDYMPRVRKTARKPGGIVYTEIASPWPLRDVWFLARVERQKAPGGWLMKWKMLQGNIRENSGAWWVSALPGNRTRLRYEGDVALFVAIPPTLLRMVEEHELPKVVQAVRVRSVKDAPLQCKQTVTERFE